MSLMVPCRACQALTEVTRLRSPGAPMQWLAHAVMSLKVIDRASRVPKTSNCRFDSSWIPGVGKC